MKRKTNIQIVKSLLKEMDGNMMLQLVVMTSLSNYCEGALKLTEEEWKKGCCNLVNLESWKSACERVLKIIEEGR